MLDFVVLQGDCLDVLPTLMPGSVDAVVTSPPYAEQRKAQYGGVPEGEYPGWTVAWMNALRPALKPRASVIINIRPHVRNGVISDYVLRTRLALRDAGWFEIDEMVWFKKGGAPLGHAGRPRRSWESLLWFAPTNDPWCDPKARGSCSARIGGEGHGRAARFGWSHLGGNQTPLSYGVARVSDVVSVSPRANENSDGDNDHPAPYPEALADWCMALVSPIGGTILDPFSGSASTGVAALNSSRHYIGIERDPAYVQSSTRRLTKVPMSLLDMDISA